MRMLIIDDESEVTDTIAGMYSWQELDIRDVVCFNDGKKAYEYIQNHRVDIMVTDIKMPKLSGLELSEEARKLYPDVKIIILSGYDDFSYAQRAVKLGVIDYILKPFSFDDIIQNVKKAIAMANVEKYRREAEEKYRANLKNYVEQLKKLFFLNLKHECKSGEVEWNRKLTEMGIRHPESVCTAVCVQIIKKSATESGIWLESDQEIIKFAVINILNEIYDGRSILYNNGDDRIILLLFECGTESMLLKSIRRSMDVIEDALQIRISVGIGKLCRAYANLYDASVRAADVCSELVFFERHTVSFEPTEQYMVAYPSDLEKRLLDCIRYDSDGMNEVKHTVDEWFLQMNHHIKRDNLIYICGTILAMAAKKLVSEGITAAAEYDGVYWSETVKGCETVSDLKSCVLSGFRKLIELLNEEKLSKSEAILHQVVRYIDEHIQEDISLTTLANEAGLSAGYLALLIKEHLGMNYSKYVLSKRLEKAKYLLSNTQKRIGEIAETVGYKNKRYFSEMFKENTGCKPSVYRKEHSKSDN